jgi:hypothetical protein
LGQFVAFESEATNLVAGDTNGMQDIFVHETLTGATTRVSVASDGTEANGVSYEPSVGGWYVAFQSLASNLVAGDTNLIGDIFVHEILTGATTRVSVASDGTEANGASYGASMSHIGRHVTFFSAAINLVASDTNGMQDTFVHDTWDNTTTRVNIAYDGTQGNAYSYSASISGDGRYVAFESGATNLVPGDTNDWSDVFRVINPLYVP